MNVTLNNVLLFGAGVAVGVLVSANYFKKKYEQIAQEEIDSVKRAFTAPPAEPVAEEEEEVSYEPTPEDVEAINDIIETCEYGNDYASKFSIRKEETGVPKPYVISPAEFDTEEGYDAYSLTHYSDGVLCDEQDRVIEDVEGMVGKDFANHYGEYEEDAVHVRNPALKCDFEILRDLCAYSDKYQNGARPSDD